MGTVLCTILQPDDVMRGMLPLHRCQGAEDDYLRLQGVWGVNGCSRLLASSILRHLRAQLSLAAVMR